MRFIRAEFQFSNPAKVGLRPVRCVALVNTDAVHLCLPENLAIQLDLRELERREVTLANGHRMTVSYCGPVEIQFKNRRCFTGVMILGEEPLIGPISMEDMDLVIVPSRLSVDVNPESTNIPLSITK